jgi:hypothetical protein
VSAFASLPWRTSPTELNGSEEIVSAFCRALSVVGAFFVWRIDDRFPFVRGPQSLSFRFLVAVPRGRTDFDLEDDHIVAELRLRFGPSV